MAFTWWPVNRSYFLQVPVSNWRVKSEIRSFIKEISNPIDQLPPVISRVRGLYLFPPENLFATDKISYDYLNLLSCTLVNGVSYDYDRNGGSSGLLFDGFSGYLETNKSPEYFSPTVGDSHLCYVATYLWFADVGVDYTYMGTTEGAGGGTFSVGGIII